MSNKKNQRAEQSPMLGLELMSEHRTYVYPSDARDIEHESSINPPEFYATIDERRNGKDDATFIVKFTHIASGELVELMHHEESVGTYILVPTLEEAYAIAKHGCDHFEKNLQWFDAMVRQNRGTFVLVDEDEDDDDDPDPLGFIHDPDGGTRPIRKSLRRTEEDDDEA